VRGRLTLLVAVASALLIVGSPRPGLGQSFDKHYKRGLALYQEKDYEGAVAEMSAAYEQRQLPRLLLNIGQAYRKMGKAREALLYYERYLKADPGAPPQLKAEIDSYIEQTRTLIEAPKVQDTIEKNNEPAPSGWDRDSGQMTPEYATQLKEAERHRPIYKRAWFWGVLGGAAAAAIIIGVSVGVTESRQLPSGIDIIHF
jgi:tetratricopeptide (TPR) repeat protein